MTGFEQYQKAVKNTVVKQLRKATGNHELPADLVSAEVTGSGMIITFHYQKNAFDIAAAAEATARTLNDTGIMAEPRDDSDSVCVEITGDQGDIALVLEGVAYQQNLGRVLSSQRAGRGGGRV